MSLETLYQEILLDHYKRPRNRGRIEDADIHEHGLNPFCGDQIELYVKLDGDRVVDARFDGAGCSISQASASMLTEAIRGKRLAEVLRFAREVEAVLKGESDGEVDLGEIEALRGVSKFPVRIKCALLAWKVLEGALANADEGISPKGDEGGSAEHDEEGAAEKSGGVRESSGERPSG